MTIMHNTAHAQAANCHLCLHIGTTAIFFGERKGKGYGLRIEILTPMQKFRISPWRA
jgi:hypothetical protein